MRRRHFLVTMATGGTIVTDARRLPGGDGRRVPRLMLAPHLDMFRHLAGDNLTEQMAFLHQTGFRAVDDSRLTSRDVEAQVEIGQAARRYGITVGQFEGVVSFGEPLFASGRSCDWRQVLNDLQTAVRVGQRAAAGFCTVVPGVVDHRLSWARQFQNARNLLDECSQLCASAGLTLLLEPLRHPSRRRRMLIEDVHTACLMCASLARSSCRAVLDTCCRRMRPVSRHVARIKISHLHCGLAHQLHGLHETRCPERTGSVIFYPIRQHPGTGSSARSGTQPLPEFFDRRMILLCQFVRWCVWLQRGRIK